MKGMTLMSRTLSAPHRGFSAAVAGAVALALLALVALGLAPQANAAFSLGKCAGTSITGEGGSFARDAHGQFNFSLQKIYCPASGLNVTYKPEGSGAGINSMVNRGLEPRFGHTDDPPTAEQVAQMNAGTTTPGTDANPDDNGEVHVVPAAVGAVVALVNFPDGCNPEDITDNEFRTVTQAEISGDATKKSLLRVRFPKATFEKIWAQGGSGSPAAPLMQWSDLPGLSGKSACEKPIIRVVRFDQSGTTFTLKDYLGAINPSREWKTKYATTGANLTRDWPGAEFGEGGQCGATAAPGKQADELDHLTTNCGKGNGQLISKLVETDGSVGYADLATARNNNPTLAVNGSAGSPPDKFWTQVQNGSGEFAEPTDDPNGYLTTTGIGAGPHKGANCLDATLTNVPASTLGDWSQTSAVDSPEGWGICTLTYGLVFDDNAETWGNTPSEEAKARTVKDYWESALSAASQALLFPADYAALPASVLAISRTGIEEVGWDKAGDGSGPGGGGDSGGSGGDTGGGSVATPLPVKPSNLFTLPRKSISSKTGGATVSVKLPGAGKLVMVGTAKVQIAQKRKSKRKQRKSKTIQVGQVVLNANKAGTFNLTLKPSGAAKKELRKQGKLRVSLKLTFTPSGGEAKTTTTGLTLKLSTNKRKGKRHHR